MPAECLKPAVGVENFNDSTGVWTDHSSSWIKDAYGIVRDGAGEDAGSEPRTGPYFTDASALTPALGYPSTIILGPGEAGASTIADFQCNAQPRPTGLPHVRTHTLAAREAAD